MTKLDWAERIAAKNATWYYDITAVARLLRAERARAVRMCKHVKAHAAFNETDAAARNGYTAACNGCIEAIKGDT